MTFEFGPSAKRKVADGNKHSDVLVAIFIFIFRDGQPQM
jgi:hypothetical protein